MFKFFLGKLGEFVSSTVVETFWSKVVDQTADNALNNINTIKNFDLTFKTLLQDMKSLSAMASDVNDQIKNQELSGRKKRKRQVEEWLGRVKYVEEEMVELETRVESEGFIARLEDGGYVAKLNEQVLKLVEQSRDFGELVLDVCGSSGETLLAYGMVGEAFHENLETIMQLLESREVSSIGVYGMGGVGKTTLAKQINNRLLQRSERSVFWVTVSQEFTITSLQDKIARLLGVDFSDEDEVPKRATRLHSALSEMKDSVLILDDVWENIDLLEVGCSFSTDCCRLIITSRSLEVCRRIRCEKIIRVEKLGENEAWELFIETIGNEKELCPQVYKIAKSVAKLCDGLPLGIITVAASMRGEKAIYKWKNALTELKESLAGQDGLGDIKVFKVLKYSFDRLKRNDERDNNELNLIQRCFMFCLLYPEDYVVIRDDLVRYFISDGLLDKRSRRTQIEQGHSILDELVNLCLLESCVNYENEESVKMHDLVRSMALKIGEGKYMVRVGHRSLKDIYVPNEEECTKDLEKVSFKNSVIGRIEDEASPNCPNLSSLFLCSNKLNHIPDSFFSKMQGLCTLDLSWNPDIEMIPNSIGDMTRLKALLLKGCEKLETVPYLGKLKAMRELNLSGTAIKEVPQGVEELSNLRFFSIDAPGLKLFPKGLLLKLEHLEHLSLPFHMPVEIEEIENLKRLEEFGGAVKTVSDFNRFIRSQMHHPSYRIGVNLKNAFLLLFRKGGGLGGKNELVLCESNINDEKVLGQSIVHLKISECEGLNKCFVDNLSRLDNPTSLKSVSIEFCGGIEYILRSSDGQGLPASQFSNTLEEIYLLRLDDMKVVAQRVETVAAASVVPAQPLFSFLKKLTISHCEKMGKVGLPISGFPNLEDIHISECEEVEEIFEEDEGRATSIDTTLHKLRSLYLWKLPKLKEVGLPISGVPNLHFLSIEHCREIKEIFQEDVGRNPVTTLPRLISLKLKDLPSLKSVSKATIISNSIYRIEIRKCPRLMKKLPLHMDVPLSPLLKEIKVEKEWWESLEWDFNPNLPQLLQPVLRFQK